MLRSISPVELARHVALQIAERASEADKQGKLPAEDIQLLRDSGYLILNIPTEFGGYGLGLADCLEAHLELSQGSASTAMVAGMQLQIFGGILDAQSYSPDVIERLCRYAVNGGLFNAVASEPKMGSPSRGGRFETVAVPHRDGWLINGHKTWITGGRHLTHLLVKLMIEDDPGVMLVFGDSPGLRWEETWQHALSLRASETDEVYLEAVVVPHDHLLQRGSSEGPPNVWFPMVMASVYLGTAIAARNAVIQFVLERVPTALGKPIATLPSIQRQIGEIDLGLQAARLLLMDVAHDLEGNVEHYKTLFPRVAAAKFFSVETATKVTEQTLQIVGGQGMSSELPFERYFRDVRAGLMQPPSGDTALEMIGKHAIGAIPTEFNQA